MTEEETIQELAEENKGSQYLTTLIFVVPTILAIVIGLARLVKSL